MASEPNSSQLPFVNKVLLALGRTHAFQDHLWHYNSRVKSSCCKTLWPPKLNTYYLILYGK